jgi:hypothetical protein
LALAQFGCGGSQGGGAGSPTVPVAGPLPDSAREGTAFVTVDLAKNRVDVTPLGGSAGRSRNALYAGSAISAELTDLQVDGGDLGRRVVRLRLRNNTGVPIGDQNGYRVIFADLAEESNSFDLTNRLRIQGIAGTGAAGSTDGAALSANTSPTAVAAGPLGTVVIGQATNIRLLRNGQLTTMRNGVGNVGGVLYFADAARGTEYAIYTERTTHVVRLLNLRSNGLSTFAGLAGTSGDVVGTPSATRFTEPIGLAYESLTPTSGSILVCDSASGKVKRIAFTITNGVPTATATSIAYNGLTTPTGVAVSPRGNVAVTETNANRVKIYIAGSGNFAQIGLGTPLSYGRASGIGLPNPAGVAFVGESAYISHINHASLTALIPMDGGNLTSAANWFALRAMGEPSLPGSADGNTSARLQTGITSLGADRDRILVPDTGNHRVREISADGNFVTIGNEFLGGFGRRIQLGNATGTITNYTTPKPYLKFDTPLPPNEWREVGTINFLLEQDVTRFSFVMQIEGDTSSLTPGEGVTSGPATIGSSNSYVRELARTAPLVGGGDRGETSIPNARDVASDGQGNLFIVDPSRVWRYDAKTERFTVIAGQSLEGNVDGLGNSARFSDLRSVIVSQDGRRIYVAGSSAIRCLFWNGFNVNEPESYVVGTVVGSNTSAGNVTGPGTTARLQNITDLAITQDGRTLWIASDFGIFLMRADFNGGYAADPNNYTLTVGFATIESRAPFLVAIGKRGDLVYTHLPSGGNPSELYAIDLLNYTYRIPVPISTSPVNGIGGTSRGFQAIALDGAGSLYFAMPAPNASLGFVRRMTTTGMVSTLAGGGPNARNAAGSDSQLLLPSQGCVTPSGDYVFIAPDRIALVQRVVRK